MSPIRPKIGILLFSTDILRLKYFLVPYRYHYLPPTPTPTPQKIKICEHKESR